MANVTENSEQERREFTDEEIKRLAQYMDVLIQMDMKEKARVRRLEQEPIGYTMLGEGRHCSLCERSVYDDGWFDRWGFKCSNCQDAVNKRKIPGSLCRDHDHTKAIPDTTLAIKLGAKVNQVRKLIRERKIVARAIPHGPNMILRKDNPNLSDILGKLTK